MNIAKLSVTASQKRLLDVNDIKIPAYTLNGIVGRSGSGKTTFCKAITGHIDADITTSIFISGSIAPRQERIKWTNYVDSRTYMFEQLTVEETIYLAHNMYRNSEFTVSEIVQQLDLESCKSTRVAHISAGERKRTQIARNIVNGAPFLVIDEPISELDEISSSKVMRILKNMSQNVSVVCTIHTSHCLEMFDNLTILDHGLCAFHGSRVMCDQIRTRMHVPLCLVSHEFHDVEYSDCVLHNVTVPVSWMLQLFYNFVHQYIVYKRLMALYLLIVFSMSLTVAAHVLFGYWDPEYDEYIRCFAKGIHLTLFVNYFPFTYTSMMHVFKHSMFPFLCTDAINNRRDILNFVIADHVLSCAFSVGLTVAVYTVKSFIFTDVHYTMEIFTVATYYTLSILNMSCICICLFKDFYFVQVSMQLTLVGILLTNGVTFPVRALGSIFESLYCANPVNAFMRVAYDENMKQYDVAEMFTPYECYFSPIGYLRLLTLATTLAWMLVARCRVHR